MTAGNEKDRLTAALWGMFVGDALAMPVHWYYNTAALKRDYGTVRDYVNPKNPHPDSILWRSAPPKTVNGKGDILKDQFQYYGPNGRGIHYHQVLRAGDNTLNLQVNRVLMKNVIANGGYDPNKFLDAYVDYMINTPNKDTYAEVYHREFFSNFAHGLPLNKCAGPEGHDTASIGGLVAMAPVAMLLWRRGTAGRQRAIEHLRLTHQSRKLETYALSYANLIADLIDGKDLATSVRKAAAAVGETVDRYVKLKPDQVINGAIFSPACYIEHSYPGLLYLALKYSSQPPTPATFEEAITANTMVGGDNCHRGPVLGSILGAAWGTSAIPPRWIEGLTRRKEYAEGIDQFATLAINLSADS